MAKQIKFTYDGVNYTLEYTRRSIQQMESDGFIVSELSVRPLTMLPKFFAGAFKAHHRSTSQETIDKIYSLMTCKEALISTLAEMYNEPLSVLMAEPDGKSPKKVEWETSE